MGGGGAGGTGECDDDSGMRHLHLMALPPIVGQVCGNDDMTILYIEFH